jgi:hypothetical protein
MKIFFICSSLEPGRDGAGDQARSLAAQLTKSGHEVMLASLNEQNISDRITEHQDSEGVSLMVDRLPAGFSAGAKLKIIKSTVKKYRPDWVSLQFVNFGYHRYGLPWKLIMPLRDAIGKSKLNIMFQELWCGIGPTPGVKERILGAMQMIFLKIMLLRLKPNAVFTNNNQYLSMLRKLGVTAKLAPVFGNIPLSVFGDDKEWDSIKNRVQLNEIDIRTGKLLVVGFFGTVYPVEDLQLLLANTHQAAKILGRKLTILIIGHGRGVDVKPLVEGFSDTLYFKLGELTPEMINRAMQLVDIGIITTPTSVLNKSSTGSAWLERGIPLLLPNSDKTYNKSNLISRGIFQAGSPEDVIACFNAKGNFKPKNRFKEIVDTYEGLNVTTVHKEIEIAGR